MYITYANNEEYNNIVLRQDPQHKIIVFETLYRSKKQISNHQNYLFHNNLLRPAGDVTTIRCRSTEARELMHVQVIRLSNPTGGLFLVLPQNKSMKCNSRIQIYLYIGLWIRSSQGFL